MASPELFKYNPREIPREELQATFVAREAIRDDILDELCARDDAPTNQHFLIIGPRGIGKTNLLLMVRYGVLGDDELAGAYLPLQTAEEEYSIAALRDLIAKILTLALDEAHDHQLASALEKMDKDRDDDRSAERGIEALRDFSERTGRKLLLLVDNIDLILDEQVTDEAQLGRLRDLLMNESFLVLIGAAPTYFKEVTEYDRPFYQFFRTVDLRDLTLDQMIDMLRRRAEWDGDQRVLDRLEELRPRLRAVHHLTGGNPRLVLMLYQLCTASELPEVQGAVNALLDDMTPYYKHRLEQLPPQQRRVMDTFARLGRPATPTELADEVRLKVNQVNSILKRLRDHGFVELARQERRKKTYYLVSERMFRIWHQMRFSTSRRRLEFLVEFIRIWYTPEEWSSEADRLIGRYRALAGEEQYADAEPVLEHLDYMAAAAPAPESAYDVSDRTVRACIESGDFGHAEDLLREQRRRYEKDGNQERLAETWFLCAYLRFEQGNRENEVGALKQCLKADPDHHKALNNWRAAFHREARHKEGEEAKVLLVQTCQKYREALEIRPDNADALSNWGTALVDRALLEQGSAAEDLFMQAYEKYAMAAEIKPDDRQVFLGWGNALLAHAQSTSGDEAEALLGEACEKYSAALEIAPQNHEVINNWGVALSDLALLNEGSEREDLLVKAAKRVEEALAVARSAQNKNGLRRYATHLFHIELLRCEGAVEKANFGNARNFFHDALDRMPNVEQSVATRELTDFFRRSAREKTAGLCAGFLDEMRDRRLEHEVGVLEPFARAVEYWQSDEDAEVLDRLNPEVREVVEQIIAQGERPIGETIETS
jgi:hypothetical protein